MTLNSYYSIAYLAVFLPVVIAAYTAVPKKVRWAVLLAASGFFFWCISGKLLIWLIVSVISIHYAGIWLSLLKEERGRCLAEAPKGEKRAIRQRFQKKMLAVASGMALFNIGLLTALKYTPFFVGNINSLLSGLGIEKTLPVPALAVPIGISFYTLQAVSYVMDVYREKIPAERNLFRLALYMSFFPQLMEGPICRYAQTAHVLWAGERIRFANLVSGAQRIIFGMMKKLVIADRLNPFIKNVFSDYMSYDGGVTALAAVLYTCQLYMDFSGTMDIVIGTGEIFGVRLPENFRQPFFSRTISEFWQRWHITLGTWFKDYVFFPLSMTKPMKNMTARARKRIGSHYGPLIAGAVSLGAVWLLNGLWHGAGWHYIFFGLYHFTWILAGSLIQPVSEKLCRRLHIRRTGCAWQAMQIVRTAVLVCVGELFFRAEGLRAGLKMFWNMVCNFRLDALADGTLFQMGFDRKDALIVGAALIFIFVNSVLKERRVCPRQWLAARPLAVRWALCYGLILFVVIFGAYGVGYVPLDPIYANF